MKRNLTPVKGTNNSKTSKSTANPAKTTQAVAKKTEIVTGYTPKLILSDAFLHQVSYLHKNVTQNTEWSGILLYKNEQATIDDPTNWVIKVTGCILMDIGTHSYTEYDMDSSDEEVANAWMDHLESGGKIGHLHTHHNMNCYFSPTDMTELHDNAPNHNYYLSLIVNYRDVNAWCAKVAICGTEKEEGVLTTTKSWKGASGNLTKVETESVETSKEVLYLMNCNIEREFDSLVPEGLQARIDSLLAAKLKPKVTYSTAYSHGATYNYREKKWETPIESPNEEISFSPGYVSNGQGGTSRLNNLRIFTDASDDLEDWDKFVANGSSNETNEIDFSAGSIFINRYAPSKVRSSLLRILSLNDKTALVLADCIYNLGKQTIKEQAKILNSSASIFKKVLEEEFSEDLKDMHLHAIVNSMYDLLHPYRELSTYVGIDLILEKYLLKEGEFDANVVQKLTGLETWEQTCLAIVQ